MSGYKERALLDGALRVFARDGYSRASIQSLATEAGVSTRTIYNRYGSKEALFRAVILDSANRVAEREIALADRLLGRIADLRRDLIAFGVAWATPDPASQSHFAMIRQVAADADHIDPDVLAAWRRAGPERVRSAIAEHLLVMSSQRLVKVQDGQIAAVHLIQLTAGTVNSIASATDIEHVVTEGVDVFLAAYGR
ncbi:TetR/AcrR family transcriptional regulator [Prescottella agglutinans]|uniref:TetR/AcrR family transcriptional regulator n=1 Tax=Prescottella agglutinans TaxID=1644129 RepID=A0A438BHV2_9NOCA|nr:TetR/AcrR family transcriptional regulator [Prescottella agglutinans]RVW10522.1 TetR/AcrR family transcriptional regulator [Prescottella agglutinans]